MPQAKSIILDVKNLLLDMRHRYVSSTPTTRLEMSCQPDESHGEAKQLSPHPQDTIHTHMQTERKFHYSVYVVLLNPEVLNLLKSDDGTPNATH